MHTLIRASKTNNLEEFISLVFPESWDGVGAAILETGAEIVSYECSWAPRWSPIPMTIRIGNSELETATKSVIFRVHDALHQLWGLPDSGNFSEDDFYYYKRAQMCGEVAVLTLTEFKFCMSLYIRFPEIRSLLLSRNALPLIIDGPLHDKTIEELAIRLDGLLHKKIFPRWARENKYAAAFIKDYVPMLEKDREQVDINWNLMKEINWKPHNAPFVRYGRNLDGLELTTWMIKDFEHLLKSSAKVDYALRNFNINRRRRIILPDGWVS
jgi:hypothetical protein